MIEEQRRSERQPRQYRITCLIRRADGHLRAVGYSKNGDGVGYDGIWTVGRTRRAIEQGHRLYTVSPSTGYEADLELYAGQLRTKPSENTDNNLENLPDCRQR